MAMRSGGAGIAIMMAFQIRNVPGQVGQSLFPGMCFDVVDDHDHSGRSYDDESRLLAGS